MFWALYLKHIYSPGFKVCFSLFTWFLYKDGFATFFHVSFFLFSGEFIVVNKHLLKDLTELGLWSHALKTKIIYENGSVSKISEIPEELKAIYKYGCFLTVLSHTFHYPVM